MRIKHTGQLPCPTNPHHAAGAFHAFEAKRAICNLAAGVVPTVVYPTPVPVTTKKRRRVVTPAAV